MLPSGVLGALCISLVVTVVVVLLVRDPQWSAARDTLFQALASRMDGVVTRDGVTGSIDGIPCSLVLRYADGCEIVLDGEGFSQGMPYIEGPNGKLFKNLRLEIKGQEKTLRGLPDNAPQEGDFYDCVRTRRPFALNEANGHRSCTLINLGTTAVHHGCAPRAQPAL